MLYSIKVKPPPYAERDGFFVAKYRLTTNESYLLFHLKIIVLLTAECRIYSALCRGTDDLPVSTGYSS